MEQISIHPRRLRTWRFHAPGTAGTIYMAGATEEEAIISLARVRGSTVFTDPTLFEGKGGWILENKLSGRSTIVTRGKPM